MTGNNAKNWTRKQLKIAFLLYCQLPFGKLHSRNPDIIKLAELFGRTPSSVAMKLVNFASLDPLITGSGRVGLKGASRLDKEIWAEFHANWESLALESEQLRLQLLEDKGLSEPIPIDNSEMFTLADYSGETRQVLVQQRIKQQFFRKAVLNSYRGRCCMSGVSDSSFLVASHIVPWSEDKANRLNPSNGLCLSAIHDRAFDQALISLTDDYRVLLSERLLHSKDDFLKTTFLSLKDRPIEIPERFAPAPEFLAKHRARFEGGC